MWPHVLSIYIGTLLLVSSLWKLGLSRSGNWIYEKGAVAVPGLFVLFLGAAGDVYVYHDLSIAAFLSATILNNIYICR